MASNPPLITIGITCFIAVDEPLVIQHKTRTADKAGRKPLVFGLGVFVITNKNHGW